MSRASELLGLAGRLSELAARLDEAAYRVGSLRATTWSGASAAAYDAHIAVAKARWVAASDAFGAMSRAMAREGALAAHAAPEAHEPTRDLRATLNAVAAAAPSTRLMTSDERTLGDTLVDGTQHAGAAAVKGMASLLHAAEENPQDLAALLTGALLIDMGIKGEAAGGALDLTGAGAAVGVPLNVVSAAAITTGAALVTAGGLHLVHEARAEPVTVVEMGREATTPTDRHKEHLTRDDLDAARRELNGEVVVRKVSGTPYDHVHEVQDSQRGLLRRILRLKQLISDSRTGPVERQLYSDELAEASRLLDYSRGFVP